MDVEQPTEKPRRGRPPRGTTEAPAGLPPHQATPTTRAISVLEKRLSGASPFGVESVSIPMKEPGWTCYIASGQRSDMRLWEMVNVKGWVPVRLDDLASKPDDIGFSVTADGTICRGPKGQEVVFKMPTRDYQQLVKAKTAANMKSVGSSSRTKAELVKAAEQKFGDEAASYIHDHAFGEVRDTRVIETRD